MYLEDARGERLALVQCDLGAISSLLHAQVARSIVHETDIAVDRLLLSATHTHAGPGGYFGELFYNYWGANRPGYDPRIVTFLTERIAEAVLIAYRTRAPARLAIGHTTLYGLTYNRSLAAYAQNQSRSTPDESLWTMLPEYLAVDPTLTMLRLDRIDGTRTHPLGAWTNFAIHGTALPPSNDLYSGDVHAAAERSLEWAIQRQYRVTSEVIHALTNGAAGDVTPAVSTQDFEEAERLGLHLGAKAFELFQELDFRLTDAVQLDSNYEEVSFLVPHIVDDMAVCQQAMVGVPVPESAVAERALSYGLTLGTQAGGRLAAPQGCQTWKRQALGPLQDLNPTTDFPSTLTVQTLRINDLLLLAVPGEMTVEMGRRVQQAALQQAAYTHQGMKQAVLVGLANHHVGYFTTPEEYTQQHYEGAATLYGQASGPFIASRVLRLVEQMAVSNVRARLPRQWLFRPGPKIQALPEARTMPGARAAGPIRIERTTTPPHVSFRWQDLGPGAIELDQPLVSVETQERDGRWSLLFLNDIPVNDQGLHLEIRHLEAQPATGASLWQATWYPAGEVATPLRFVIAARGIHPVLYSEPFILR
jgi:neutral ceramidase